MTDTRSNIAGRYVPDCPEIVCILDEGNITVSEGMIDMYGHTQRGFSLAAPLEEGMFVAISNDSACTFVACGGVPCVEKAVNSENLVIGQIIGAPKWVNQPATSAAADSLTKRLAGKFYRVAKVRFLTVTGVMKATVTCDGSNATVQGVGATLSLNMAAEYASGKGGQVIELIQVASGGTGLIPLHYVAAGTAGDKASCLVAFSGGLLDSVTGA